MTMKKILIVIALSIVTMAVPICANAEVYNVNCENGTYTVTTVDPSYFDEEDEEEAMEQFEDFFEELSEIICEGYGSRPV